MLCFCIFKNCFCKVNKPSIHLLDLLPTFFLMDIEAIIKQTGSLKMASGQCITNSEAQVYKILWRFLIFFPWLHLSTFSYEVVLDSAESYHIKVTY